MHAKGHSASCGARSMSCQHDRTPKVNSTGLVLTVLIVFFTLLASLSLAQDIPLAKTEMAPMRDSVRLATDFHLPPGQGPWPVVLIRTPYGRKNQALQASNFVRNRFAFVSQDWRGLFDSEGTFSTEMVTGTRNQEVDRCVSQRL
jgi:predicted acyl esterase